MSRQYHTLPDFFQKSDLQTLTALVSSPILIQGLFTLTPTGSQLHSFSFSHVTLALLQCGVLVLSQNDENSHTPTYSLPILSTCALSFDTRFEILRDSNSETLSKPIGLKLQKQGHQNITFYSSQPEFMCQWKLELGKRINERGFHSLFRPIRKVGKGNFASVYLVERLEDHKLLAVKAFSKETTFAQEKGRESLINEIGVMRRLQHHAHLMHLEGVYESENSIYLAVQLLEGGQLFTEIQKKRRFSDEEVVRIMRGLLSGLRHMHKNRVMHRDLKPENILLRYKGGDEVVIADFGLATWADEEEYLFSRCGTPGYVAPEVINIRDLSTKSDPVCDVFSAGLIFHILLMGRSVFPGRTYNEVLAQNRACNFSLDTQEYRCKLNPEALDLLIRMLDTNPLTRISASEALEHSYFWDQKSESSSLKSSPLSLDEAMDLEPMTMSPTGLSEQPKFGEQENQGNYLFETLVLRKKQESVDTEVQEKLSQKTASSSRKSSQPGLKKQVSKKSKTTVTKINNQNNLAARRQKKSNQLREKQCQRRMVC